jgi:hypothetical protein
MQPSVRVHSQFLEPSPNPRAHANRVPLTPQLPRLHALYIVGVAQEIDGVPLITVWSDYI